MTSFYIDEELSQLGLKSYGKNVLISRIGAVSQVRHNTEPWMMYASLPDIMFKQRKRNMIKLVNGPMLNSVNRWSEKLILFYTNEFMSHNCLLVA